MNICKLIVSMFVFFANGCAAATGHKEVAGCYKVNLSPSVLQITYERSLSQFSVPRKIELNNKPSAGFVDDSGFMIARSLDKKFVDDEGFFWEMSENVLSLRMGDDSSGISARLIRNDVGFSGSARPYLDVGPVEFTEGVMSLEKTLCGAPQ